MVSLYVSIVSKANYIKEEIYKMTDGEAILVGWIYEESQRLGKNLVEGIDYDVIRMSGSLFIAYYTDPDHDGIQIFEVDDDNSMLLN